MTVHGQSTAFMQSRDCVVSFHILFSAVYNIIATKISLLQFYFGAIQDVSHFAFVIIIKNPSFKVHIRNQF